MLRTSTMIPLFVILIALAAGGFYYFRDTDPPKVQLQPSDGPVSATRPLQLSVEDAGSGLRRLTVTARQGDKSHLLIDRDLSGTPGEKLTEELSLSGLELQNAPFQLVVRATDRSVYHFGQGNSAEPGFALEFDSKPPTISVLSRQHNLNQGGTGLVVYSVSEEVTRTGVSMGDRFFPAYRQPSGHFACLFGLPYDASPTQLTPRLIAEDAAGNLRQTGFQYFANPRKPPQARIELSDAFLDSKMPNFQHLFPTAGTMLEVFLKVNRELRTANRQKLLEIGRETDPGQLWQGSFMREPGANREPFGAERSYYYGGRQVDRQTHLGVDLASVAQGPVHAANSGKVVFADDFGIYGQCVIIDHGLGLQSLYGHLSSISVATGDRVGRGQEIGRTGATGLAGGDHLHFGLLVSGLAVNPVEWWDPNWVQNNITGKLELAAGQ